MYVHSLYIRGVILRGCQAASKVLYVLCTIGTYLSHI